MDKKQIITKTEHVFNLVQVSLKVCQRTKWKPIVFNTMGFHFGNIFVDLRIFKPVLFLSLLCGINRPYGN